MVGEAPRRADHDARAVVQRGELLTIGATAGQDRDADTQRLAQARQDRSDLLRELARRQHDDRFDAAGAGLKPLQERQAERERLARAGARLDAQVTALKGRRERLLLDGCGDFVLLRGEAREQLWLERPGFEPIEWFHRGLPVQGAAV